MRIFAFIISALITITLIVILNTTLILPAPLGKLLSPQHGLWQNAKAVNEDFNADLKFPQLKGKVNVYLDERLVPHIFAEDENDAWFVQGYLHAKFRLWQMELQTHAAAGRASEIIGDIALKHDREFRRLGMVYAAENSLKAMESDAATKAQCDAYTAGVNAYIENLSESILPIEYKLIGYMPERWSNLKTALFLKYMSYDLAGHDDDFEMSNAKSFFSTEDFQKIYPAMPDSSSPIVPNDTSLLHAALQISPPANADSLYFNKKEFLNVSENEPDKENGSNNWAVSGSKTKSGYPILCNDPHLGLRLPSLWYEVQVSTPAFNAYGVSFPGSPGVIIGFNDSCAFGFTNGGRDVRDYYEINFKDDSRKEYWYNNTWKRTDFRIERIKIKGKPDYLDTVAYTVFGPVMYDKSFGGNKNTNTKYYAVKWKAHDPSNDLKCFMLLDRAKNYSDYSEAVKYLHTPGQNCVFACKNGDIALKAQGEFPAKWNGQGDFIMPGVDDTYAWQAMIPQSENPFQYNPTRGFVSSANQRPADSSYPYYLGRGYPPYRGFIINRKLSEMSNITPEDMMALQADNYDVFAEMAKPLFVNNIKEEELNTIEKKYFDLLKNWNLRDDANSTGATVFNVVWKRLAEQVWSDEFAKAPEIIMRPYESTLLEGVLKDSAFKFLDNITTPQIETLQDDITIAFKNAAADLKKLDAEGKLEWAKNKELKIMHLARLNQFSRIDLFAGGGTHCINATKQNHGPSWRMVVSLTPETQAYGIYPGGQDGNPSSAYYDNFINKWVAGEYYKLWVMKPSEQADKRVKWKMSFGSGRR
jgi:penicillin amidase